MLLFNKYDTNDNYEKFNRGGGGVPITTANLGDRIERNDNEGTR